MEIYIPAKIFLVFLLMFTFDGDGQMTTYQRSAGLSLSILDEILDAVRDIGGVFQKMDEMEAKIQKEIKKDISDLKVLINSKGYGTNLALKKNTFMSVVYIVDTLGYKGVDGDPRTAVHTGSNGPDLDWWIVDLGESHTVGKIVVTPRTDSYYHQVSNTLISVGDTFDGQNFNHTQFTLCAKIGNNDREPIHLKCDNPIEGRYVALYRVQKGVLGIHFIAFLEFEVYSADLCDTN